jgi:hypothetical protein
MIDPSERRATAAQAPHLRETLKHALPPADIRSRARRTRLCASTESSPPMVLVRIAMVGVVIAAMLVVARDQRWFERSGIVGRCYATTAAGATSDDLWYACRQGILNGFPNLPADACSREVLVSHQEIWRCNVPLTSLPGA